MTSNDIKSDTQIHSVHFKL